MKNNVKNVLTAETKELRKIKNKKLNDSHEFREEYFNINIYYILLLALYKITKNSDSPL